MAPAKKTFKKKVYKKKTTKPVNSMVTYNKTSVPMGLGFPKRMTMCHKYHETVNLSSTMGALSTYNFSANGMFDPNLTATGLQPYYFDQCAALYDHYCVIGSKITFTVLNLGLGFPGIFGCYVNDDTAVTPNIDGLVTNSNGFHKYINYGQTNVVTAKLGWSGKKIFGKAFNLGSATMKGDALSNPVETSVFTLYMKPLDLSTQTLLFDVNIEYIAIWDELRDVPNS